MSKPVPWATLWLSAWGHLRAAGSITHVLSNSCLELPCSPVTPSISKKKQHIPILKMQVSD